MKEQDNFITSIFETIQSIIYIFDLETQKLVYANNQVEKLTGYTFVELQSFGNNFVNIFFHHEDIPTFFHEINEILKNPHNTLSSQDYRVRCKNGEFKWFESQTTVYKFDKNNKPIRLMGNAQDITQRKIFEAELRLSEEKYRNFVNHSPSIFYKFSNIRGGLFWSEKVTEILGYSSDDLTENPFLWFNSIHDEDKPSVKQAIEDYNKKSDYRIEYRILSKLGKWKWLEDCFIYKSINGTEIIIEGNAKDITDSKIAEIQLQKEKEKADNYKIQLSMIENNLINGMIYQLISSDEKNRKFVYISNIVTKFYGCTPEQVYKNPNLIYGRIYKDDLQMVIDAEAVAINTMSVFDLEIRMTNPDNSLRWSRFISRPRVNKNLIFWDGIEIDITDYKNNQFALNEAIEKMKESNANIKAIIENTTNNIWAVNTDYKLTYINKVFKDEFIKTFGIELNIGDHVIDKLPVHLQATWKERYKRVFDNEQFVVEDKIEIAPDIYIYIQISMNPIIKDNKIIGASFFGINITKQRQQEAELIKAKEKAEYNENYNKMLFEILPTGLALTKMNGDLVYVNKAYTDIIGYSTEETLKLTYWDITPSKYSEQEHIQLENLNTTGFFGPYEKEYIHKTGKLIPVRLNGRIIETNNEKFIWSSIEDISEKKKSEKLLIEAKEKAEESDRLKSVFLKNISHEIRTPMNAIIGFSHLLSTHDNNIFKQKQFTEIVHKSLNQLLRVIENIITISQIETNQLKINSIVFNPNKIITEIFEEFKYLNTKNINFKYTLQNNFEISLESDFTRIKQIFKALLDNSFKFTDTGTIEFGYNLIENQIVFFVKDTGIGIDKENQEIIFKRFAQADENVRELFGGMGLGLSIVKGLVKLIGGNLSIYSVREDGTEIKFSLNINKKEISLNQNNKTDQTNFSNKIILIAEDEDFNFQYIEEILSGTGVVIIRAENGLRAVEIFKSQKVDLILMDIKMPLMDGFEATSEIRKINSKIPIIAQTAFSYKREECIKHGFVDYIAKPFNETSLIKIIEQHI